MKVKKVLIIGLDGADPRLVEKWVDERRLPTMKMIMREGTSGELISTFPSARDHSIISF